MAGKITCKELAVDGCELVAEGDTPADVVRQVVAHLRKHHHLDMPDVDDILSGRTVTDEIVEGDWDEGVKPVVRRLRKYLDIEPTSEPEVSGVPIASAQQSPQFP